MAITASGFLMTEPDLPARLARKWCSVHGTERIEFRRETCSCPRVAAAVREALEEAKAREMELKEALSEAIGWMKFNDEADFWYGEQQKPTLREEIERLSAIND